MSTNFEVVSLKKCGLIFILILCSLWINSRSGVVAQEIGAAKVQNQSNSLALCADMPELKICQTTDLTQDLKESAQNFCSKDTDCGACREATRKIRVVLTGYSSTVAQTDSTPFITANGTYVRDGIVANNGLPFGTEIRIPSLYGNKVFSVQDRMHQRMGTHKFDIWFPTYEQAKNFGVKYAYVEILKK